MNPEAAPASPAFGPPARPESAAASGSRIACARPTAGFAHGQPADVRGVLSTKGPTVPRGAFPPRSASNLYLWGGSWNLTGAGSHLILRGENGAALSWGFCNLFRMFAARAHCA